MVWWGKLKSEIFTHELTNGGKDLPTRVIRDTKIGRNIAKAAKTKSLDLGLGPGAIFKGRSGLVGDLTKKSRDSLSAADQVRRKTQLSIKAMKGTNEGVKILRRSRSFISKARDRK